jgi:hypothetical protein
MPTLRNLELLGCYDEIAREHLARDQRSQLEDETIKGKANCMWWMSENDFLCLGGDKLLKCKQLLKLLLLMPLPMFPMKKIF